MCNNTNCNDASCCGECEPWNCLEQQINDTLATKEGQLQGYVGEAKDAAAESRASAEASAQSAAESKEFRDEAETAASTAVAAEGVVLGVANTLQDTADKLEQIAGELGTAIAGIAVYSWFYTTVTENQTVIPIPVDKNAVDVQSIYIEGSRQSPFRGFEFDKTSMIITLAEPLPLGLEIEIILGTYNSDNPNDFAHTLASDNGASLVGTASGITVQQEINNFSVNTREHWRRQLANVGLNLVDGSFEEGATVASATDAIWHAAGGQCYTWGGAFPKTVDLASTPASSGGVSGTAWVSVTDLTLRTALASEHGFGNVGGSTYAQIRAYAGLLFRVYCLGRSNVFDGGYGFFEVDATDTTSSDNGGTILVDAIGRRWKRQYDGKIMASWFTVGDGAVDDTATYQTMVSHANAISAAVHIPAGYSIRITVASEIPIKGISGDNRMTSGIITDINSSSITDYGVIYNPTSGQGRQYAGTIEKMFFKVPDNSETGISVVRLVSPSMGTTMRDVSIICRRGACVSAKSFYYFTFDNCAFTGKYFNPDAVTGDANALRGLAFRPDKDDGFNNVLFLKCDFRWLENVVEAPGQFLSLIHI